MYPELLHEVYFKFSSNVEINKIILHKYPPNTQQQLICKRLNVPSALWSFYLFRKESIYDSLVLGRYLRYVYRNGIQYGIRYFADESFMTYNYSQYQDMILTEDEKFFIYYHSDILYYQQNCFCFNDAVPSLQDLCSYKILESKSKNKSYKVWLTLLPKCLSSRLQDEMEMELWRCRVKMPKYNPKETKFQLYNTCYKLKNLFSKIDAGPFPKNFVVWFQKDPVICQRFQPDCPIRIIFFNFKRIRPVPSTTFKFCLRCMKRCWDYYAEKIGLKRCYYSNDDSYSDQIKSMQNPCNWCTKCKRIPLFQVLSPEEYGEKYGGGQLSKVEYFL